LLENLQLVKEINYIKKVVATEPSVDIHI